MPLTLILLNVNNLNPQTAAHINFVVSLPPTPAVCSTNESAKDGYIKDSLSSRLSVSAALGNDFLS